MRIPPFVINEPIPEDIKQKMNEEYYVEFKKIAKDKKNKFSNTDLTPEQRKEPLWFIQATLLSEVQERIKQKYHYYDYINQKDS